VVVAGWSVSGLAAVSSRLDAVAKLIEESSAGQLFDQVALAEAREKHDKSVDLLSQARHLAEQGGDEETINDLLDAATREMLMAVRLAQQESDIHRAADKEFDSLSESLDALLEAYLRIRSELAGNAKSNDLSPVIQQGRAKAIQLRKEGHTIDIRGGETLVRSLRFDTPRDEYLYEIDRNDSLRMLVQVLLKERMASDERLAVLVDARIGEADALRGEAEVQAGIQRYEEAIETLEASSLELVRAILRAGVYIPR
jgi:tetratricopeptide (TPR) repeat protein